MSAALCPCCPGGFLGPSASKWLPPPGQRPGWEASPGPPPAGSGALQPPVPGSALPLGPCRGPRLGARPGGLAHVPAKAGTPGTPGTAGTSRFVTSSRRATDRPDTPELRASLPRTVRSVCSVGCLGAPAVPSAGLAPGGQSGTVRSGPVTTGRLHPAQGGPARGSSGAGEEQPPCAAGRTGSGVAVPRAGSCVPTVRPVVFRGHGSPSTPRTPAGRRGLAAPPLGRPGVVPRPSSRGCLPAGPRLPCRDAPFPCAVGLAPAALPGGARGSAPSRRAEPPERRSCCCGRWLRPPPVGTLCHKVAGSMPWWGEYRRQPIVCLCHIDVFLPLFPLLSLSVTQ